MEGTDFSYKLIHLYYESRDFDTLLKEGKAYVDSGGVPKPIDWFFMGMAAKELKQFERAIGLFDKALVPDKRLFAPVNRYVEGWAYFHKADILDDKWRGSREPNLLKDAQYCYTQCTLYHPNYAAAHYNLGCIEALLGNQETALQHLINAFSADPRGVQKDLKNDLDWGSLRRTEIFQYLLSLNPEEVDLLAKTEEELPDGLLQSLTPHWENQLYHITCPICGEEHRYTLRVARILNAAKAIGFKDELNFHTTRIFLCPKTRKPFRAEISLTESFFNILLAIVVEGTPGGRSDGT